MCNFFQHSDTASRSFFLTRSRYTVIVPDLFFRDPVPLNADMATFSFPDWMGGKFGAKGIAHVPETVDPVVAASLKAVRGKYGVKVGVPS